jgi:hypothetical protein
VRISFVRRDFKEEDSPKELAEKDILPGLPFEEISYCGDTSIEGFASLYMLSFLS